MRLTEFRLPYPVVELGQSAGMAVGNAFSALGGVTIESIELQDHGGVLVTLSNKDQWAFSATGYGRIESDADRKRQAEAKKKAAAA